MFSQTKNTIYRWLRWSEQYIRTDMVYLVSRSGLSMMGQIVTALATLGFAIVVGHYLPKAVYGEYKYALAIITLLSFFSLNNISGAVFQSTAQGYDGSLHKGFWANIRWSIGVFVGAFAVAIYYFFLHNSRLAEEILIGGSFAPFVASATLYSPFLAGKKDFIRQIIYSVIDNLATIGMMIGAVLLTDSPLILVGVYFASNLLAALFFYRRTEQLYASRGGKTDESMLTYSKHLSVLGILGGIVDTLDQILVFHFAGAAQLAVFSFATALPDQAQTPMKTMDTMIQSGFVRRTTEEIHSGIANKFLWYFILSACGVVCYILAAPFIFKIFFPAYIDSIRYSQIYVVWIIACTFDPATSYFGSRKKIRELYIGGIFFILCQTVTMVVGIIWWGILGLIVAQVATRILSALLSYLLYLRTMSYDLAKIR